MGNLETIVLSRSRVNHPAFCGKGHAHASCNMQQRRDCNAASKKKSWKCIEVASKQACVRASLKTAFTPRNAMVFVCQKGLPNHFKSLMYTNTQRRNPYNEHDSSRKTGFRLRRCCLCPSCPPFEIFAEMREAKGCLIVDTWPKPGVIPNRGYSGWDTNQIFAQLSMRIHDSEKTNCSPKSHNFKLSTVTPKKTKIIGLLTVIWDT